MTNLSIFPEFNENSIVSLIPDFFDYYGYGFEGYFLLKELGRISSGKGFKLYLVGGFVRDLAICLFSYRTSSDTKSPLQGLKSTFYPSKTLDIDLALEGDMTKFISFVSEALVFPASKIETHRTFGTASIELAINKIPLKIDVATVRTEFYEFPGALPTVEFKKATLENDVLRRDFTVNSIAVSINSSDFLSVKDYLNGLTDIKDKKIRILHEKSFEDDPTRIFRAVRFEQRLGFKIESQTLLLIQKALNFKFIEQISGKRIANEIYLLLKEQKPWIYIERLNELGILKTLNPRLRFAATSKNVFKKICSFFSGSGQWDNYSEALECGGISRLKGLYGGHDPNVYFLAEIFRRLTIEDVESIMERLSIDKKSKTAIIKIYSDFKILNKYKKDKIFNKKTTNASIVEKLNLMDDKSLLFYLFTHWKCDDDSLILIKTIVKYLSSLIFVRPEINGQDLKSMGIGQGAVCGNILNELRLLKLDGKLKDRKSEMDYIKKKFISNEKN